MKRFVRAAVIAVVLTLFVAAVVLAAAINLALFVAAPFAYMCIAALVLGTCGGLAWLVIWSLSE